MLRLDRHLAVFRTAPERIAIGAQQRVAELDADPPTLRGIAALTRGVLPRELAQLIGDEPARALLEAVGPALTTAAPAVPVLVRGRIRLAEQVHRAARDSGHAAGEGALIVPVAPWRLPMAERERLLAAGAAHLPVVAGDAWVQVGPFVPEGGGCPRCATATDVAVLPAHLTPAPTPIAAAQTVVTVLEALRRAGEGELPAGWCARIRQRDGVVSAVRRRPCRHEQRAERSLPGTGMAA